jgi:probable F420-dependent oxidoreductase
LADAPRSIATEIGVLIPHIGPLASAELVPAFCVAAEAAGFDGLWTADHLVAPVRVTSPYPDGTRVPDGAVPEAMGLNLEMHTTLAVAAAVTRRVRLCTGVAILTIRNAILNARQLASIDLYSGGRVLCGVGIGWLEDEAKAMSMPWYRRGARAEEHIALLRALWTAEGDVVEFNGRFHTLPPMDPDPRPVQRPIPVIIGGHSDAALERVARIGDGWIATGLPPEQIVQALTRLGAACERHARRMDDLVIAMGERFTLDLARGDVGRQVASIVEGLDTYAAVGITHMKVGVRAASAAAALETLDAYGHEVLPAIR